MTRLVRKLLRCKPFKPFRIVMRSGERHDVTDPDRVAISRSYIMWFPPTGRMARLEKREIDVVYEPRRSRS